MLLTSKEANLFHNREVKEIMRRMYSEQELSIIIHDVVGDYIEEGAFDESIASAVDAYLEENPVDITALEGQDVELNSLDADGLITGGEIIEKMSGYSFTKDNNLQSNGITLNYIGVVKTGNKITFSVSGEVIPNADMESNPTIGYFTIPTSVKNKLVPNSLDYLDNKAVYFLSNATQVGTPLPVVMKPSTAIQMFQVKAQLTASTTYVFRYEVTFLLSENLAL